MILHQPYTDALYRQAVSECLDPTRSNMGDVHHHFARLIIYQCFDILSEHNAMSYNTNFDSARMALHDYWSE